MELLHLGGATNFENDAMVRTPSFSEFSSKVSYRIFFSKWMQELEIYSGIKNMFNAYQNDFDIGKNRDSNYIYGPSTPRIVYIGLRIKL
jgi:outer membrane receptor for ferrienterochelin and colicins